MFLKIEADLNSQLKISWGDNDGIQFFYSVGAQAIRDAADELRVELSLLARWSLTKGNAVTVAPHSRLISLAKAGSNLRYLLLKGADQNLIDELKTWLKDEYDSGNQQMSIQADSSIHVPWGLIFDGPIPTPQAAESDSKKQLLQFSGFWCLKYRLSAYHRGVLRSRNRMKRNRSSFGILSLLNPDVMAKCTPTEVTELTALLVPPLGVANDIDRCNHLLETENQTDILLFFFGHNKNSTLDLGNGNLIDYVGFSSLMDTLGSRRAAQSQSSCGLVFLNACESAVGKADVSLRAETVRSTICGAVATECVVPRKYATKFGTRFLTAITIQEKSVGETMGELHHDIDLWPESLFYGCYAHPDFRIEHPA